MNHWLVVSTFNPSEYCGSKNHHFVSKHQVWFPPKVGWHAENDDIFLPRKKKSYFPFASSLFHRDSLFHGVWKKSPHNWGSGKISSQKNNLKFFEFLLPSPWPMNPLLPSTRGLRKPGLQSPQHGRVEVPGDPAVIFWSWEINAEAICLRMVMWSGQTYDIVTNLFGANRSCFWSRFKLTRWYDTVIVIAHLM